MDTYRIQGRESDGALYPIRKAAGSGCGDSTLNIIPAISSSCCSPPVTFRAVTNTCPELMDRGAKLALPPFSQRP